MIGDVDVLPERQFTAWPCAVFLRRGFVIAPETQTQASIGKPEGRGLPFCRCLPLQTPHPGTGQNPLENFDSNPPNVGIRPDEKKPRGARLPVTLSRAFMLRTSGVSARVAGFRSEKQTCCAKRDRDIPPCVVPADSAKAFQRYLKNLGGGENAPKFEVQCYTKKKTEK